MTWNKYYMYTRICMKALGGLTHDNAHSRKWRDKWRHKCSVLWQVLG